VSRAITLLGILNVEAGRYARAQRSRSLHCVRPFAVSNRAMTPVTRSLSRCAASAESSTTAGVAGSVVTTGATLGAELGSAAVRGAGSTRGPQAKRRTSVVANVVKGSLLAHGITRTVASCRGVCQANRLTTQIAAVVSPMELLYTESPEAIGSHAHFCAP